MPPVLFLGAGFSRSFGIPTMPEMVAEFENQEMPGDHRALVKKVRDKLQDYRGYDLEALMSVLGAMMSDDSLYLTFNDPVLHYFGKAQQGSWHGAFDDAKQLAQQDRQLAQEVMKRLRSYILRICNDRVDESKLRLIRGLIKQLLEVEGMGFVESGAVGPVDVFTTNYDMIVERFCVSKGYTYQSGETNGRVVDLRSLSANHPRVGVTLFKLHGSINWWLATGGQLRYTDSISEPGTKTVLGESLHEELAIFPLPAAKYALRDPFAPLFIKLKAVLESTKRACVIGYSFRDEEVLGMFVDALRSNQKLKLLIWDPRSLDLKKHQFGFLGPTVLNRIFCVPGDFNESLILNVQHQANEGWGD